MPRALLIANPTAGRLRPPAIEAVVGVLRAAGWAVESALTTGPGDARRLAAQAAADGAEVVAVFGGDGTTMQAASALVGTGVALGVIPGGTGNVLAGNLRIPAAPVRAARALLRGRPRPFDLGRVERPGGPHYFAVACGAGYDARVMAATLAEHKRRWGMAAYVATTLRLMPAIRCAAHRITVDGVEYTAEAAMVLVANCGEVIPPFIRLHAGIRPDDGVLDVVVLRANGLGQSVRAVWALLREAPELGGVPGALAAYARGREVRVETEPVEPVQLDGDPAGETPFTAAVVPGAITIIAPPGWGRRRDGGGHGAAAATD